MGDERFADRHDAGRVLATHLTGYAGHGDAIVLGLARGGVPVAYEVARALDVPFDVLTVRKLGVPGREEVAMGAIATGGVRVINPGIVDVVGVDHEQIEQVVARERAELERREHAYRGDRGPIRVEGRTAIVVDDGLATGATMRAAVAALRRRHAGSIVVAVPIASPRTCAKIAEIADAVVCARTREPFTAVGLWYRDFSQTSDEDVRRLLDQADGHDAS